MIAPSGPGLTAVGGQKVTMDEFVLGLTRADNSVERPVLNHTGLPGAYDFTLEWRVESGDPAAPASDAGVSFFDALRQQMGLKLIAGTGPVEHLVVDKVERPTPN